MMKKYVSLLIFSIALLSAKAQIFQPQASYGFQYKRLKTDSTALIPTFCGTPNLRGSTVINQAGIGYDSCGHVFYVYDPPSHTWISVLGGGGTGSRVDSITVIDSVLCLWQAGISLCANLKKDTIELGFGLGTNRNPTNGHQILFALHPDGLVSGGIVTSAGGLNIDITSAVYWKNFKSYISPARTIVLPAASGSNPRKDVPIVDTNSLASSLTGTPAANPLEPQPNPTSQLKLTAIDIPTGATSLNVITKFIYQEGVVPWDTSHSGTIDVAFRNTANPHLGTHSVYAKTYTDGSQVIFTDSGVDTVVNSTILKFFLFLPNRLTNHLQLQLFNGATVVSSNIDITSYLNPLDTTEWENVSIPVPTAFSLPGGAIFNKLKLTHSGADVSGAGGYYLDDIQLQTGISQAQIDFSNKLDSVTKFQDSILLNWVKGIIIRRDTLHLGSTGGGSVTSIATTSPITGGTITTTGTIACATCVVATVNPSAGVAHFAGSTQTTTSSLIVNADITNSTIDLTTKVTGVLPIANGGTNLSTYTTGDLLYASATNVLSKLPIGTTGKKLTVVGGLPAWVDSAAAIKINLTGVTNNSWFKWDSANVQIVPFTFIANPPLLMDLNTNTITADTTTAITGLATKADVLNAGGSSLDSNNVWKIAGNNLTDSVNKYLGSNGSSTIPIMFRWHNVKYGQLGGVLNNTFYGSFAPNTVSAAVDNVAQGVGNLQALTSGHENTAQGFNSLTANTTGSNNTAAGSGSLITNTTGNFNNAFGYRALADNLTTNNNNAYGYLALTHTTGAHNSGFGGGVMSANSMTGSFNAGFGVNALASLTSGSNNVAFGPYSLYYLTTQSNIFGVDNQDRTNFLGHQTAGLLYGNFNATPFSQIMTVNGNLGIFNYLPGARVDIPPSTAVAGTGQIILRRTNIVTTAAAGTGTVCTLTFASQTIPPFIVGSTIVIAGVTPSGYNTTAIVTACTLTTVSFAGSTTGAQTVAGAITQGQHPTGLVDGMITRGDSLNVSVDIGSGINLRTYNFDKSLTVTATLDFPSVASLGVQSLTITVTGAADGDITSIGVPNGSMTAGLVFTSWVSSANTVTIQCYNSTVGAIDPASGTFRAAVTKY